MQQPFDDAVGAMVDSPLAERMGLQDAHFYAAYTGARSRLAQGDPLGAVEDFGKLVIVAPRTIAFHLGLAEAAIAADMPELGLQAAAAAMALEPAAPEAFFHSALACLRMKETALALEDLQDALARCGPAPQHAAMAQTIRALICQHEPA